MFFSFNESANKHNVFISFYHHDDQKYKEYIDKYLSQNIINKSVKDGEYDPDNSDQYIKRLIREEKITDSSVVVVLVGPNTKGRKHVDWEIYAALRSQLGNLNSGLVGILLPNFPRNLDGSYQYKDLPARLADNVKSGYAKVYDWKYAIYNFGAIIQDAFDNRISKRNLIDNSRIQKKKNS